MKEESKNDPIFILENLSIGHTAKNPLFSNCNKINEKIYPGALICLCGPNGGGKSTLLKTLSGFIKPLEGKITINGKDIHKLDKPQLSKLLSVVFTDNDFTNLNGVELVSLGRTPHTGFFGRLNNYDRTIVDKALEAVNASSLKYRKISSLSDGERQRLLIAKALAQETDIILLDEPTAFLDYPSKIEVMRLLKNLCHKENKTIIISIHDLEIAFSITDYLWFIDKHLGLATGTLNELEKNGDIEKYFNAAGLSFNNQISKFIIN